MAKSISNCYCLVFLPSIAQSFILEITLAYILQYYTGSPHIVRNSGRKFWLNFGSALAFEWSLKSHEAIYCSNPFEIFKSYRALSKQYYYLYFKSLYAFLLLQCRKSYVVLCKTDRYLDQVEILSGISYQIKPGSALIIIQKINISTSSF